MNTWLHVLREKILQPPVPEGAPGKPTGADLEVIENKKLNGGKESTRRREALQVEIGRGRSPSALSAQILANTILTRFHSPWTNAHEENMCSVARATKLW